MKKILVVILLFSVLIPTFSLEWPDEPERIIGFFGAPEDGHFARGIRFKAEGQKVKTWSAGEVIWVNNSDQVIPDVPKVVIQHENGFQTTYAAVRIRPDLVNTVSQGEWIAHADEGSWNFQLADSLRRRIMDPLVVLPLRVSHFNKKSVEAVLLSDAGKLSLGDETQNVSPGLFTLALQGGKAIHDVSLYWKDQNIASFVMESLTEIHGDILMETPQITPYSELYDTEENLLFHDFLLDPGTGRLEMRVRDYNGRIISFLWPLNVGGDSP